MSARLDERTRQLHGTARKRPAATPVTAPRLMRPIPPPKDMPQEIRQQWKLHMALVVAGGRMSSIDLLAFRQLCQCAHGVEVAHAEAMAVGPSEEGQQERKAGIAWRMWLSTMAAYERWLAVFGLTPRSRGAVPPLTALPAELHVIEGRQ